MTRRALPAVLSIAFIVAATTTIAAPPLAEHLPADTMLYVGWSGSQDLGPEYAKSHMKAMIELSQIDRFISDVMPTAFEKLADQAPAAEAEDVARFMSTLGLTVWKHPAAVAFCGVDLSGETPLPQMALVCDAGKDADELVKALKEMTAQAGDFPVEVKTVGTRVVLTVGKLTADQAAALGLIKTVAAVPRLSDNKSFQAAVARTVKNPVAIAYVDGERMLKLIDDSVAKAAEEGDLDEDGLKKWQQAKKALGLEGFKRAVFGAGIDGRHWGTRGFVEVPAPRRGITALLESEPISDDLLAAIPATASLASGANFDIARAVEVVKQIAKEFDADASQAIDQGFDQASAMAGFDLIDDFLKPMGGQWAYYIDEGNGSSGMFGSIAVNRLRDPAKFKKSAQQIEMMLNQIIAAQVEDQDVTVRIKKATVDGTELHYFAIPLISPTWAIRDGNLYLGLQPQFVASAAHHVSSGGKSIVDNPDFARLRKQLEAEKFGSFQFVDLPKTAPDSYSMLTAISRIFVGLGDMAGVEDTPTWLLPPMYQLKPHLTPSATFTWADDKGYYVRSVESFPGSNMFSFGTTGGLGTLMWSAVPGLLVRAAEDTIDVNAFDEIAP